MAVSTEPGVLGSLSVSRLTPADLKREIRRGDTEAFCKLVIARLAKPRRRFLKKLASEPLLALWTVETARQNGRERELAGSVESLVLSASEASPAAQRVGKRIGKPQKRKIEHDGAEGRLCFSEILANWLIEAVSPLGSWELLAVSEMLLRDAEFLPAELLVGLLAVLQSDANSNPMLPGYNAMSGWIGESVNSASICAAEWARGLVIGMLGLPATHLKSVSGTLNQILLACCDEDGLPHGSILKNASALAAVTTESTIWSAAFQQSLWEEAAEKRMNAFVARTAMMLLPSGALVSCVSDPVVDQSSPSAALEFPQIPGILKHALRNVNAHPARKLRRLIAECGDADTSNATSTSRLRSKSRRQSAAGAKRPGKQQIAWQSDRSCTALMRSSLESTSDVICAEWHSGDTTLNFAPFGIPVFSGPWTWKLSIDDVAVQAEPTWNCSCWFADREASFAELESRISADLTLVRHLLLLPQDHLLFLTDTVMCSRPEARLQFTSGIPLLSDVVGEPDPITRELTLRNSRNSELVVRSFPIWMADDRIEFDSGHLRTDDRELQALAIGKGAVAVPLVFDWNPRHSDSPADWNRLTVAESRRIVSGAEAAGYRLRVGKFQCLLYRSLKSPLAHRTVLGLHTADESVYARVTPKGQVEALVHVEPYST